MMLRILFGVVFLISGLLSGVSYAAPGMVFDLDKQAIAITTGFNGDHINVFGTKKSSEDVIVVVSGPKRDMKVRQKEKIMGGWINRSFVIFQDVPSFYRIASSKPLEDIAPPEILMKEAVGLNNLVLFHKGFEAAPPESNLSYQKALLRNKQALGLFSDQLDQVEHPNDRFIKASFYLPHNVSLGDYTVDVLYFDRGRLVNKISRSFNVHQVGINAHILAFAHNYPLFYGLMCVFLAIFSGWLSNRLKRVL